MKKNHFFRLNAKNGKNDLPFTNDLPIVGHNIISLNFGVVNDFQILNYYQIQT